MIKRSVKLSKNNSLIIFGPRGSGKSTLIRELFSGENTLWIDLLTDADEEKYARKPDELSKQLVGKSYDRVVIDEVQKCPKLLDIVHKEIEEKKVTFILTGSSARKLRRGAANLLAGRAFTYHLFPFTFIELGEKFNLDQVLCFGSLPKVIEFSETEDKKNFLKSYVKTYLKEEVLVEQLVRQIEPFRDFLEIAAQSNGEIINYSKLSRDVGVDDKSIKNYFEILEDTLIGFHLKAFHRSIRKQQRESPKFYFFDLGVKRALDQTLNVPLVSHTYAFGRAFEHFVILELYRLNEYFQKDYRLSYLKTKDQAEIDLVIQRPGQADLLVEIKSKSFITGDDTRTLERFFRDWDKAVEAQVWSLEEDSKQVANVRCINWRKALSSLF